MDECIEFSWSETSIRLTLKMHITKSSLDIKIDWRICMLWFEHGSYNISKVYQMSVRIVFVSFYFSKVGSPNEMKLRQQSPVFNRGKILFSLINSFYFYILFVSITITLVRRKKKTWKTFECSSRSLELYFMDSNVSFKPYIEIFFKI